MRLRFFLCMLILIVCPVCTLLPTIPAYGLEPIKISVLSFRPKPQTMAQWQPLAVALKQAIPQYDFVVEALTYPELNTAVANRKTDFVLTNPSHYVLLKKRSGLSAPLATLAFNERGRPISSFGGVIICRADQSNITSLRDIKGKTIAIPDKESLGGYQMQAYELFLAGVRLPQDAKLITTGMPHDKVIEAVLSGKADVGFVRSGVLEGSAQEGKLDSTRIKILNLQNIPEFPLNVSTPLYPEWPFSSMPRINEDIARRVAASLFSLEENRAATRAMNIHGFVVPADYTTVENALRELRLPPFDSAPSFTIGDVWTRYHWQAIFTLVTTGLILILGLRLLVTNRKLHQSNLRFKQLAGVFPETIFEASPDGSITYVNKHGLEQFRYSDSESFTGVNIFSMVAPEHRQKVIDRVKARLQNATSNNDLFEYKAMRADGTTFDAIGISVPNYENGKLTGLRGFVLDISVRKEMEEELRHSEEKFRNLVENTSDCIWETNSRGLFIYLSPSFRNITGYPPEEFLGKSPADMFPDEMKRQLGEQMFNSIANQQPFYTMEYSVVQRQGGIVTVEVSGVPMFDCEGEFIGMHGIARDISERKTAENAVQQLIHEQTIILDNAGVGISFVRNRQQQWANTTFAKIFGYSTEEMKGSRTVTYFQSQEEYTLFTEEAYPVLASGETFTKSLLMPRKDGSLFHARFTGTAINPDNLFEGSIWILSDETAQRELEETRKKEQALLKRSEIKFSTIFQTSPDIIAISEKSTGRFIEVNDAFERIVGYSREEAIGRTAFELKTWGSDLYRQQMLDRLADQKRLMNYQTRFRRKNGEIFPILLSLELAEIDGVECFIISARDITELEKIKKELRKQITLAESANRAKSEFLSNMSHEIRTPMNGVIGMAYLLELTDLTQEQKEYVASLKLSGKNLLSLINDILDLSKIESGKISIEPEDFSLQQCISDVVLTQKSVILNKGLLLHVTIADNVPYVIRGDQLRVKQILLNLLGNAVKFTKQGEITISAQILEQKNESIILQISVRDTGIGISTDALEKVFSPFVQEDGSISRQFGGTGLGLSICRKLTELMGGAISVESTQGVGSCFKVNLPFVMVMKSPPGKKGKDHVTTWEGPPLRILLVDDNAINIKVGAALLRMFGHDVSCAEDGRACLELLERGEFDLLLLDIQMPIMDGEQTLKEIRIKEQGSSRYLPIIAVTAYALREEKERFLTEGFDGYVSKPLSPDELMSEMKRVVTNSKKLLQHDL